MIEARAKLTRSAVDLRGCGIRIEPLRVPRIMVVLTLGPLELRRRERTEGAAVFWSSQIGIGGLCPLLSD